MEINGNKIVKFIYDTDYEQFEGETREEATVKFERWINSNTPYRGLNMYAKHKGYNLIFEDAFGNRYMHNGMSTYKVDKYGNLIERIK
jgi:hypothetical protein